MLNRSLASIPLVVVLGWSPALAQETKPEQSKPAPQERPASGQRDIAANIKLEIAITDQTGPGAASKRNVTMHVANNRRGSIRSSGVVTNAGTRFSVQLNVDAHPVILSGTGNPEGAIMLTLAMEYQPKPGSDNAGTGEGRAELNEQIAVILQSGKPTIVSQAADPTSDRKISVEVTATILK
jgi:hypothetical protein